MGVEQTKYVHTIDHDHEFEFLEIGHIGEWAEVPFNAKAWCSVITGSWITQHLGLTIIQVRDSCRIFFNEGWVLIDGVIVDGNHFVSKEQAVDLWCWKGLSVQELCWRRRESGYHLTTEEIYTFRVSHT